MFPFASLANLPPLPHLSLFSDHASSRDNPPLSALSFSLLFFYLRLRSFSSALSLLFLPFLSFPLSRSYFGAGVELQLPSSPPSCAA